MAKLKNHKQLLLNLLKLIVTVSLLAYLFRKTDLQTFVSLLRSISLKWFLVALAISFTANFIACWRWYYLMRQNRLIEVTYWQAVKIYYIAVFFNNFLPSSVGGDAVKVLKIRALSQNTSGSLSSVLVDRLIGLLAAIVLAFLMLTFDLSQLRHFLPYLGFSGLLLAMIIVLLVEQKKMFKILRPFFRLFKKEDFLVSFLETLQNYLKNKRVMRINFLLALVYQAMCNLLVYYLALSLGFKISFLPFFIIMPIVTLITLIPISINGLGLQDASMVALFAPLGFSVPAVLSLSILTHLQRFLFSLIGGGAVLLEYALGLQSKFKKEPPLAKIKNI